MPHIVRSGRVKKLGYVGRTIKCVSRDLGFESN